MNDNLIIGFEMLFVGMTAVFAALTLFAVLIYFMKKIDIKIQNMKNKVDDNKTINKTISTTEADATSDIGSENIPSEIIAVLTAAAYTTFGKKVVLKRFSTTNSTTSNWSSIGRQILSSSHQTKSNI